MLDFAFTAEPAFKDVPGFLEADCKLEKKFVDGLAMAFGLAAVVAVDVVKVFSPVTEPGRFNNPSLAAVDSFAVGATGPEETRFAG